MTTKKEWYYARDGQKFGPMSFDELKATSELQRTDYVWKDGSSEWVPACQISGLFTTPPPPPVPKPQPQPVPLPHDPKPQPQPVLLPHASGSGPAKQADRRQAGQKNKLRRATFFETLSLGCFAMCSLLGIGFVFLLTCFWPIGVVLILGAFLQPIIVAFVIRGVGRCPRCETKIIFVRSGQKCPTCRTRLLIIGRTIEEV
jgi:DNA-directed RNA polymerase subunit RPC12/RpoP